jgi:hypothetical protein
MMGVFGADRPLCGSSTTVSELLVDALWMEIGLV